MSDKESIDVSSQLTISNLSIAVVDCFWKMVQKTVELQANLFEIIYYTI